MAAFRGVSAFLHLSQQNSLAEGELWSRPLGPAINGTADKRAAAHFIVEQIRWRGGRILNSH